MKNGNTTKLNKQTSLDAILSSDLLAKMSSSELSEMIRTLQEKEKQARRQEDTVRRRKEKQEAERLAQKKEEQRKKHVQEVTSMDLPLDFYNPFLCDGRPWSLRNPSKTRPLSG
jgi:phosphomannomutase